MVGALQRRRVVRAPRSEATGIAETAALDSVENLRNLSGSMGRHAVIRLVHAAPRLLARFLDAALLLFILLIPRCASALVILDLLGCAVGVIAFRAGCSSRHGAHVGWGP